MLLSHSLTPTYDGGGPTKVDSHTNPEIRCASAVGKPEATLRVAKTWPEEDISSRSRIYCVFEATEHDKWCRLAASKSCGRGC